MREQALYRTVLECEFFLAQNTVYKLVAGPAEQGDSAR